VFYWRRSPVFRLIPQPPISSRLRSASAVAEYPFPNLGNILESPQQMKNFVFFLHTSFSFLCRRGSVPLLISFEKTPVPKLPVGVDGSERRIPYYIKRNTPPSRANLAYFSNCPLLFHPTCFVRIFDLEQVKPLAFPVPFMGFL